VFTMEMRGNTMNRTCISATNTCIYLYMKQLLNYLLVFLATIVPYISPRKSVKNNC
jgi:hypothetical protein